MQNSQKTALIAVFAALHAVLYLPEGPWRSLVIYLMPIEGIILGPLFGFSSAVLGSTIARMIKPNIFWMFGIIAEPIGVAAAGFLAKGKWKETALVCGVMLVAYFAHPYGRMLPLWTVLDLIIAFALVYPVAKTGKWLWEKPSARFLAALLLIAFVSTVADSMTRVFLMIPVGLHSLLVSSEDELVAMFVFGAVGSYLEDLFVCITTLVAGAPLLAGLRKFLNLEKPLS